MVPPTGQTRVKAAIKARYGISRMVPSIYCNIYGKCFCRVDWNQAGYSEEDTLGLQPGLNQVFVLLQQKDCSSSPFHTLPLQRCFPFIFFGAAWVSVSKAKGRAVTALWLVTPPARPLLIGWALLPGSVGRETEAQCTKSVLYNRRAPQPQCLPSDRARVYVTWF